MILFCCLPWNLTLSPKHLDDNTTAIRSLEALVRDLPTRFLQPIVEQTNTSLRSWADSAQQAKEQINASVTAAVDKLSSVRAPPPTIPPNSSSDRAAKRVNYPERRLNVIY